MGLFPTLAAPSTYFDRKFPGTRREFEEKQSVSCTLYVGNLSFYTTEEQIFELFFKCGDIKRIIMGLDRKQKTPCGFCFVEYYTQDEALNCMQFINATKLDDRIIRTDIDPGFTPDRQFGRGRSGGQVRDEFRTEYDPGRGGWGHDRLAYESQQSERQRENYGTLQSLPEGNQPELIAAESSYGSNKRNRDSDEYVGGRYSKSRNRSEHNNPRFRERDEDDLY